MHARGTQAFRPPLVVLILVAACGDNQKLAADIDAPAMHGPCWPDDGQVPKGWATLGTGREGFEPMPTVLPIEYGAQDGFDLVANVKMNGLEPGNPTDLLDPANPRTRIRAYFVSTNLPLNYFSHCPFVSGYVPSPDGNYQLPEGVGIVFENCWRAQHLIDQQVRIDLEMVDRDGGYTSNSVVVTLAAPTGFYPMEPPLPGCMH